MTNGSVPQPEDINHVELGFASHDTPDEMELLSRENREVKIPERPYPQNLPRLKSDIAPTFELDEILREYAREVLRNSVTREITHPLASARDKIIALVQRELNK